ncbi:MAG: N-acetylmuramoyl-L-alanine amidase [Tannerella sp.]|nr:N-acetylmuramoyl-L-alanine amidase [Tannerella sp.]
MAKPNEGEGVYRFLLNNGRDPKEHYEEFVKLNKNKLGKNHSLIKGVSYILPPLSTETTDNKNKNTNNNKKREPLFGKKYAEYTINSNKLRGATFFLSSGHGGPDCGAIGIAEGREIHEDEYAYDIMLRLARCLMMEGATVHIIIQDKQDGIRDDKFLKNNKKETCRGKEIPLNQVKRLQQRCDEINTLSRKSKDQYQRVIFIHLDSRSNNKQMDVFFYHHGNSAAGKRLGNTMRQTFKEHYQKHQPGRGFTGTVSPRDLYVLTNSKPVRLFAELGNIRNSNDQRRFLIDSNRQALANWMCRGFIIDYENSKK